jgi:hypothetical protein
MATVVTALVAIVLAGGATFGLVQAKSADGTAKQSTKPLVSYGTR